jgi:hypothetical protein
MTYNVDLNLVGVRETIRALNKVEPGLRKQFVADVRRISEPAIQRVRNGYDEVPLSGMSRKWTDKNTGRRLFPFTVAKAKRGVRVNVNTDRRATAIISIVQMDPATAVFESAGRANPNPLGRSLGYLAPGRTRVIGPAVYKARPLIEREMLDAIRRAMKRVQKELN